MSRQYLGTRDAVAAAEVAADIFVFPPVWSIISLEKKRDISMKLTKSVGC